MPKIKNRSHGECGICPERGITVEVFKTGSTKLTFFPKDATLSESFKVVHLPSQKGTPR